MLREAPTGDMFLDASLISLLDIIITKEFFETPFLFTFLLVDDSFGKLA